jgi:molybdate transport system permease protein
VLPPTVLGYYLLVILGAASPVGQFWEAHLFGRPLVFTFEGLLIASHRLQPALRHPADAARLRGDPARGARGGGCCG